MGVMHDKIQKHDQEILLIAGFSGCLYVIGFPKGNDVNHSID